MAKNPTYTMPRDVRRQMFLRQLEELRDTLRHTTDERVIGHIKTDIRYTCRRLAALG